MSLRSKLFASAVLAVGFALVVYGSFGPGEGVGTASGDRLSQIGFALMFIAIALALIFRRKGV